MHLKAPTISPVIEKHKTGLVHSLNGLHCVYWGHACLDASSMALMALYGSLGLLTATVSFCLHCKGKGNSSEH